MAKPMTVAAFTAAVAKTRAKSQRCVYCDRDLSDVPNSGVMFMRRAKRIACANCPEAIVLSFRGPATENR